MGGYLTDRKRQSRYFGHLHSSRYSSLVFDNRGMGLSDKPWVRYSTSEMARDTLELLQHLDWLDLEGEVPPERNLNIIGISMGGMIAQEIGLLIPHHISSLVLVSTAPRLVRTLPFFESMWQRMKWLIPSHIDTQLHQVAHQLLSNDFLALPDTEQEDPALNFPTNFERFAATELHKRSDKNGFTRTGFLLQVAAAGWHFKDAKAMMKLGDEVSRDRIAVLHGTKDRVIPIVHGELLRDELGEGIKYRTWVGRGHTLMWEEEAAFNRLIQDFAEQCASVGGLEGGDLR